MQKASLRAVVHDQEQDRRALDAGIPRTALGRVLRHAVLPHAVVVSGVRRWDILYRDIAAD